MAVPRPLLLALLATVLLVVTFMATMTSRDNGTEETAAPAPAPAPAPSRSSPGQQAAVGPAAVAKSVFAPAKPIESARFDIRLNAQELAGSRKRQAIRLTGAFQTGQAGKVPSFDLRTSNVNGGKATHDHVLSTGDKGYAFGGITAFAFDASIMAGVATFRDAVAKGTAGPTTQVAQPDPSSWLKRLKSDKPATIDGVKTSHVTAVIDPKLASADVRTLVKSLAGGTGQPVDLPNRLNVKVKRTLKTARFEAWVGTEDRIVRRLALDLRGTFPPELLEKGETARWHVGLDVNLTQVNKPQKIEAPPLIDPRAAAKGLGAKQARNASGTLLLGAVFTDPPASAVKTSVALLQSAQQQQAARKPRAVSRAVANNKRVVIFFRQPRGLDDSVTDDAVFALRKRAAVVFKDSIANVAAYGQVVMSLGVTRAPSIVIIGKSGRARLIEGYIDSGALAQEVADTR